MSSMKKTKEGINLKKLLRLKNTGSIFVIAGLLMIFVIASYTFILQSSYTKTALETEIIRDTASADAVHKLVNGRIGKEDFDQIKDQSDEKKQLYKDISSYLRRWTKGYTIKQPNMDCQPTEITALMRHRAVFSWAEEGGIPTSGA